MQDNQQMLKGVVSFITLIKLPQRVSAANCHLQGVTRSLQAIPVLSVPWVDVGYGLLGLVTGTGHHAGEVAGYRRQGRPWMRWIDSIKEATGLHLETLKKE
jgi:hypothetical protein